MAGKLKTVIGVKRRWLIAYISAVSLLIVGSYSTTTNIDAGLLTVSEAIQAYVLMILFIVGLGLLVAKIIQAWVKNRTPQDKSLIAFLLMTVLMGGFGLMNIEESVRLSESIPFAAIRAHYFMDYYIVQWLFVTSPASALALALSIYFSSKQSPGVNGVTGDSEKV
jgi:hypothetical protein